MLSKLHVGISCLVFCFVLLLGCQDDSQQLETLEPAAAFAVRAQQQFESQVLNTGRVNLENPRGYMAKTPQWQFAYPVDLSVGQGLMVPVYYDEPFYFTSSLSGKNKLVANAVTNLLVYTGADGALHYELLSSFPGNGGAGSFSGVIYVEDWNGHPLRHYQYTADGAINLLKFAGERSAASNGKTHLIEVCYYYYTWAHSALDPEGYYREELIGCEYFEIDDGSDTGGGVVPPGGGSGGGTPSPGGGSPCDPLTAAKAPAPCDGNTDPNGPKPTDPPSTPVIRKDIKNNITDPCPRDQVNRLTSSNAFLQAIFGKSEYVNLQYNLDNMGTGWLSNAGTTYVSVSGDYYTVITTLNSNSMTGASNEYIMATLIHEMYHAKRSITDPTHATNNADHTYMAQTAIFNEMASMLQSFFPGMSLQTARDLTWGGLGNTATYLAINQTERIRIEGVNYDYQKGVKGFVCAY